jgi:radical SAM superfamily enzyme
VSNKLQEIKKLLKKENMLEKQKKKFNDGHNKNNSNMKIAEYYQNLTNSYPEYFNLE